MWPRTQCLGSRWSCRKVKVSVQTPIVAKEFANEDVEDRPNRGQRMPESCEGKVIESEPARVGDGK